MTMKKLLGISLALVMLLGSVPFGFSEPLKVQLEQELEINQIQCNNPNHVLVERTNGKLACVYESTAEKLNWKIIIQTIQKISYEFPLSTKDFETTNTTDMTAPSSWYGTTELTISNLPKVGETAKVTLTFTNLNSYSTGEGFITKMHVSDNFKVIESTFTPIENPDYNSISISGSMKILATNETDSRTITIKAIKSGEATIDGTGLGDRKSFRLMIGETETLLYDDYMKINPNYLSAEQAQMIEQNKLYLNVEGEEPLYTTTEKYEDGAEEPPRNENEIQEDFDINDLTEEEWRVELEQMGYSPDEIDEIIKDLLKKNINDKVSSALHGTSTFRILGRITVMPTEFDPDTENRLFGIRVCAMDRDLTKSNPFVYNFLELDNRNHSIACTNTSKTGFYILTDVINEDPDNDGTGVDLRLRYATNGQYVTINSQSGGLYSVINVVQNNLPFTTTQVREDDNLDRYNIFNRASWIIDHISEARDFFDDIEVNVNPVTIIWQYDEKLSSISNSPCSGDGACYSRNLNGGTIGLSGTTDPDELGDEYNIMTQLHEYGHHVMRDEIGLVGWGSACTGTGHMYTTTNTEACAWSEGWADFVPHLVLDEQKIQWGSSDLTGFRNDLWIDLEKDGTTSSATADPCTSCVWPTTRGGLDIGHESEGQVASMLWDLKDDLTDSTHDVRTGTQNLDDINPRNDGNDENILIAFSDLRNVPKSSTNKLVVEDYYDRWNHHHLRNSSLDNIALLHYMGFLISEEPPVLFNVSDVTVKEGETKSFEVSATDINNDSITLEVTNAPSWVTINDRGNGKGTVTIIVPNEVTPTSYQGYVRASDNDGFDEDHFKINITEVNQNPKLSSIGDKTIRERQNLSFTISATDEDRPKQTLTYSITNTSPQQPSDVPTNISLNKSTGEFSWTPTSRQVGFHSYVFTVTDSKGATDSETVDIRVSAIPNSSPKKTPTPTSSSITTNSVTISWIAPSSGTGSITEYDIFRSASAKVLIATVPHSQLSYTDNTVLPSTTYQYTVSAKSQFGSGLESDPLEVTTTDLPKPITDVTLTDYTLVIDYNQNSMQFEWNPIQGQCLVYIIPMPYNEITGVLEMSASSQADYHKTYHLVYPISCGMGELTVDLSEINTTSAEMKYFSFIYASNTSTTWESFITHTEIAPKCRVSTQQLMSYTELWSDNNMTKNWHKFYGYAKEYNVTTPDSNFIYDSNGTTPTTVNNSITDTIQQYNMYQVLNFSYDQETCEVTH